MRNTEFDQILDSKLANPKTAARVAHFAAEYIEETRGQMSPVMTKRIHKILLACEKHLQKG